MGRVNSFLVGQAKLHEADRADLKDFSDDEISQLLSRIEIVSPIGTSFRYLFLHPRGKFIYLDDKVSSVTECTRLEILRSDLSVLWQTMVERDHGTVLTQLMTACFEALGRKYMSRNDIQVFMDYNITRRGGSKCRVVTSIKPLAWGKSGLPYISGGYFTDITHIKSEGAPVVTINSKEGVLDVFTPDDNVVRQVFPDYTPRELQILQLIASGCDMEELIKETGLSKYTIYTHRRNILAKSKLPTIPEVIRSLKLIGG